MPRGAEELLKFSLVWQKGLEHLRDETITAAVARAHDWDGQQMTIAEFRKLTREVISGSNASVETMATAVCRSNFPASEVGVQARKLSQISKLVKDVVFPERTWGWELINGDMKIAMQSYRNNAISQLHDIEKPDEHDILNKMIEILLSQRPKEVGVGIGSG